MRRWEEEEKEEGRWTGRGQSETEGWDAPRRRGGGASLRTDSFLNLIRDTGYDLVVFLDVDDSDTVKKLGQRMSDIVPLGPVGADGTNGPVAPQVKLLELQNQNQNSVG